MIKLCTVYGLYSSEDGVVRYIGQTIHSIEARRNNHIYEAFLDNRSSMIYKNCWIRKVVTSGHEVLVKPIQEDAIWNKSEIFWIDRFRAGGYNLVNLTDGGDGTLGYKQSKESREKMSKSRMGYIISEETRRKLSSAQLGEKNHMFGKKHTKEHRKKISEGNKGKKHTEEAKKKISKSLKGKSGRETSMFGKHHSEETKKRMSEAQMGEKNHNYGCHPSEETRRKLSDSRRGENNPMFGKVGENNHMFGKTGEKSPNSKTWKLTSPSGEEFIIKGLFNFCKENNLSYDVMGHIAKTNNKNHKSGWKCECLGKDSPTKKIC